MICLFATLLSGCSRQAPTPTTPANTISLWQQPRIPCLIFFLVLLVLVLGWIGMRVAMRRRAAKLARPLAVRPASQAGAEMPLGEGWKWISPPLLGHFITTYKLGEDTYDESFSIETPNGEFLGECGVSILEIIGSGQPDKVTVFEVWLFDASDIRRHGQCGLIHQRQID